MQNVIYEKKSRSQIRSFLLCSLFIAALIGFGMYTSGSYTLRDRLDLFGLVINTIPAVSFPILAVLVYVSSFAGEVRNRFLVYTRTRRPILETLRIKQTSNVKLSFLFFFFLAFIPFIYVYYIDPLVGNTVFQPSLYGLTPDSVVEDSYSRNTFTNLLQYGNLTFGIIYSLWVGLNGALYAAISFYLILLIRNSLLALSLPYVLYIVISFTLGILQLDHFRPNQSIFPFDHPQGPLWTASVPFLILLIIAIVLAVYVKRNVDKLDQLV